MGHLPLHASAFRVPRRLGLDALGIPAYILLCEGACLSIDGVDVQSGRCSVCL